jgi:hypothetical protein
MATFSRHILSGSTNGLGIPVLGATTSGGVLLHTAQAATTGEDEIWLYAVQYGTTTGLTLTVRHGGATAADEIAVAMVPGTGPIPVCPGFLLNNSLESRAFTTVSNEMSIHGWVNRVTT